MPPKISIIILNFNGLRDTIECLESLKKITYQNYNVILIDNASKNNEGQILKEKFGDYIHLIQNNKNYGFAEGNNIGIRYALKNGADYIFCLNNDTKVEKDFLEKMVKKMENEDKKIGMVAAKMLNYWQKEKIDNMGLQLTQSGLAFNIIDKNNQYLFAPSGGAALYSTEMLQDIKINNSFFDPDFFMYGEDLDLGSRAQLLGYCCKLAENAIIYHKGGTSTKHLSNFHIYYNQRNILYSIIKEFPTLVLLRYSFWIILLQLGLFLIALKRRKFKPFLKANLDIIKNIKTITIKRKIILANRKITNKEFKKLLVPKPLLWDYFFRALKH